MSKIVGAFVLASLVACGTDDDGIDPDLEPMAGTYRATWECASSACATPNPLAGVVQVVIVDSGRETEIRWAQGGSSIVHVGERSAPCTHVPAGSDNGVARLDYTLCFDDDLLWGNPTWGDSSWLVELTPL